MQDRDAGAEEKGSEWEEEGKGQEEESRGGRGEEGIGSPMTLQLELLTAEIPMLRSQGLGDTLVFPYQSRIHAWRLRKNGVLGFQYFKVLVRNLKHLQKVVTLSDLLSTT